MAALDMSPLSPDERAAGTNHESADANADGWKSVLPVPDGVEPKIPRHHLGKPTRTWEYRDPDRRLNLLVCRFDFFNDEGKSVKEVWPLTCWKAANGRHEWRWKAPPELRPLYGLDRLAKRPNRKVMIVEGEKKCGPAERLFPDYVAVTSQGGAHAAAKSDWSVLAGKDTTVWPDHDSPGLRYADDVIRCALAAGAASVRIVSIPEDWPENWDLADPLPPGVTEGDLCRMLGEAKEFDRASDEAHIPHGFRLDAKGVHKRNKNGKWVWVCSQLRIVAQTRDANGEAWGRLLEITDRDGTHHEWAMPMSLLAGDGTACREQLLSLGLIIAPGKFARDAVHEYLCLTSPKEKARCVARIGWQNGVYVLPGVTIGEQPGERVLLQLDAPTDHAFNEHGTLEGWQEHVARKAIGNSRLVLALSTAFAAPLLEITGQESGGFHVTGASSTGKTTALEVAGSAWGGGGKRHRYIEQWRATDNGLEGVAAMHNDALLCLDEISQIDAKAAGASAYMLANGRGKRRADRSGGGRPSAMWRLLFLSSGEISLADKLAEDGRVRRVTAGQQVRVIDLPADAGAGHGLFEKLHDAASPAEFSDRLRAATMEHYGQAAVIFLTKLTVAFALDAAAIASAIEGFCSEFREKYCPPDASGQVSRAFARFALVAAAGELAAALGILPWEKGEAATGVGKCAEAWLQRRGGSEAAEIIDGIKRVLDFLKTHGAARFESWEGQSETVGSHEPRIDRRVGWRKRNNEDQWDYYATSTGWQEMTAGHNHVDLSKAMIARKLLLPSRDGRSAKVLTPPGYTKMRLYHIPASALSYGADDAADKGADHA